MHTYCITGLETVYKIKSKHYFNPHSSRKYWHMARKGAALWNDVHIERTMRIRKSGPRLVRK